MLQLIVDGLLIGGVYALVAVALSLNMGVLGVLNLAITQTLLIGALVGKDLLDVDAPFIVVVVVALALGAVICGILEIVGYRFVNKDPITTLLTAVAFGLVLENIIEVRW